MTNTNILTPELLRAILPVIILQFLLMIVALILLIKNWRIQKLPGLWLAVILLVNLIGPIVYFIIGRKLTKNGDE